MANLDSNEQAIMVMAQSAEIMASTMFWKAMVKALAMDEWNSLVDLDDYLSAEAHPDREEVMTLCLRWHSRRRHRLLLLENVEQAKAKGKEFGGTLGQFMTNPGQALPDEAIVLQSGEM